MPKIEIEIPLELSKDEESQVLLHSFLNLLHILSLEFHYLRKVINDQSAFPRSIEILKNDIDSLNDFTQAVENFRNLEENKKIFFSELSSECKKRQLSTEQQKKVKKTEKILTELIDIAEIRIQELLDQIQKKSEWVTFSNKSITNKLRQTFDAMALYARGRFGIGYTKGMENEDEYCIHFIIGSQKTGHITIPPLLLDTIRDLTANARKYSKPGKCIESKLLEQDDSIELEVRDSGRGIPVDEIPRVVDYSYRASNTLSSETMGNGIGLTKAYYVTKKYKGRMWIESEPGEGTTITIIIPKPDQPEPKRKTALDRITG